MKRAGKPGRPRDLYLDDIRIDGDTQVRCKIDDATVADYADAILAGDRFPPIVVFHDGSAYWLADGFNRYHAHRRAQKAAIAAQVKPGTQTDAAWYALGANRVNGTRLTNEDKARAVKRALQLRPGTSNREIAEYVGVSDHTVEKYRLQVMPGAQMRTSTDRQGRDGKQYPVPPPPTERPPEPPPTPPVTYGPPVEPPPQMPSPPPPSPPPPPTEPPPQFPPPPRPPEEPPAGVLDRLGRSIPNDRIAEAFRREHELVALCTDVSKLKTTVLNRIDAEDTLYADITAARFEADANNLRHQIDSAKPYAVCPWCGGEGCKSCRNRGWVNNSTYDLAPRELK
ncbi:hypothetical protein LLG95_12985 [bacterium]|nr:hypothetical protein [bacterium]